jgi:hypothetical protein
MSKFDEANLMKVIHVDVDHKNTFNKQITTDE